MERFLTIALFCAATQAALGDVNPIDIYVYKGYDTLIKLERDYGYYSTQDWSKITGQNAANGEVSSFEALSTPNRGSYMSSSSMEDYQFEEAVYVCENERTANGRVQGSVLSKRQCSNGLDEEFKFYVANGKNPYVDQLYFVTCRHSGQYGTFLYSRISRRPINCIGGDQRKESGSMYVINPILRCSDPRIPENGHITSNRPDTVTYGCSFGFEIQGQDTRSCNVRTGQWTGNLPTCAKIVCRSPPTIEHATVDSRREYGYADYAQYTCDEGYEFEAGSRMQCREDRSWTNPGVICRRKDCNYPGVITNGDVVGSDYLYEDQVRFVCDHGYLLQGAQTATCLATGRWSENLPTCQKILCPTLDFPENGMRTQTDRGVDSEVIYSCREGYLLQGASTITCEQQEDGTGKWSQSQPTCSPISCSALEAPAHGTLRGDDFTYGQQVTFACDTGYMLTGSSIITCGPVGWDAPIPTCQIVQCRPPKIAQNVHIQSENQESNNYGNVLRFLCDEGYELTGAASIRCQENGRWSNQPPTCEAARCPPIPAPENGARDADDFTFGNTATFSCFPGYELQGDMQSTCQADGTWDKPAPQCRACPLGFYKDTAANEPCIACPANSMTSSVGSTSIAHCQCNSGTQSGGDGLCEVIECQRLEAPENGVISDCGTEAGAECLISCKPGYFLEGSGVRRCRAEGWSGTHSRCLPCPIATYKEGESSSTSCLPCPRHTTTDPGVPAGSSNDCFCKPGYHSPNGDGVCVDIDECAANNGSCCSQSCTNLEGSFICSCTIPGYRLSEDGCSCYLADSCPRLESDPGHGHLACSQTIEYNSAICHIKCDPGYYFVSGMNNYVTCGPDTGYEWSHRLVNRTARIPTCTEEFFVDIQLPMSFKYQSGVHCNSLPILQSQVEEQLQNVIEELNVCSKHCVVVDFNISCSDLSGQRPFQSELLMEFEVLVQNPEENAVAPECNPICRRRNMRQMLAETFKVKSELLKLVQVSSPQLNVQLPNTQLLSTSFDFGKPQMLCDEGRVFTKSRMCVPCDAGYYLPERDLETCLACPAGTYQDEKGQTSCKPCLPGSTTLTDGSNHPTMCSVRVVEVGTTTEGYQHQEQVINEDISEEEVDEILSVL